MWKDARAGNASTGNGIAGAVHTNPQAGLPAIDTHCSTVFSADREGEAVARDSMRLAALLLMLLVPQSGRAEILVEGSAAAVRLEVTQAPVGEILAALGQSYDVRYRASIALDRPISGSYAGPLARVVARILEGYDYVARVSPGAVDIAYIRERGSAKPASTVASVTRVDLPMSVGVLQK